MKFVQVEKIKEDLDDYALVLFGGAKAGAGQAGRLVFLSQIGALKTCRLVCGTSVGALDAGVVVGTKEGRCDIIAGVWDSIKTNKDVYLENLNNWFDKFCAGARAFFGKSALNPKPLYNTIATIFADDKLSDLKAVNGMDIVVTALDTTASKEEFFSSFGNDTDRLAYDVLIASSAIEGAFPSKIMRGVGTQSDHEFTDGGNAANNPFLGVHLYNEAHPDKKIKKIVMIMCYPDAQTFDYSKSKNGIDNTVKSLKTSLAAQEQIADMYIDNIVDVSDLEVCVAAPTEDPGNPINFADCPALLQKGYDEMQKLMVWNYRTKQMVPLIPFLKRKTS